MSDAPQLPEILPIFPLPGVLLLPRGRLPLNIFEPRYLAMTEDAIAGRRLIGMIQPSDPAADNRHPLVYPTGCAGRITSFAETDDGRYLITLTGVSRFRIREELPLMRSYRRVVPDWSEFASDLEREPAAELDRERLVAALQAYFAQRQLKADLDAIRKASVGEIVTSLSMMCPFEPSEKQALLDAPNLAERTQLLLAIIEMAAQPNQSGSGARH